jgi:hypothetical protein
MTLCGSPSEMHAQVTRVSLTFLESAVRAAKTVVRGLPLRDPARRREVGAGGAPRRDPPRGVLKRLEMTQAAAAQTPGMSTVRLPAERPSYGPDLVFAEQRRGSSMFDQAARQHQP